MRSFQMDKSSDSGVSDRKPGLDPFQPANESFEISNKYDPSSQMDIISDSGVFDRTPGLSFKLANVMSVGKSKKYDMDKSSDSGVFDRTPGLDPAVKESKEKIDNNFYSNRMSQDVDSRPSYSGDIQGIHSKFEQPEIRGFQSFSPNIQGIHSNFEQPEIRGRPSSSGSHRKIRLSKSEKDLFGGYKSCEKKNIQGINSLLKQPEIRGFQSFSPNIQGIHSKFEQPEIRGFQSFSPNIQGIHSKFEQPEIRVCSKSSFLKLQKRRKYITKKNKLNEICEKFNKSYKSKIIRSINSQSELPEQMKEAMDSFCETLDILSKFNITDFPSVASAIQELFTRLEGIKYTNKHGQRLCEAILWVICNAFKMSVVEIDKKFWFEKLQSYYSNENNSDEINYYALFILINTGMAAPPLSMMLLNNFMDIKEKGNQSYLGFSEEEILSVKAIGITNHLEHCKSSLTDGNKEPSLLLTYQISRDVLNVGYKQNEYYERAINSYSMSNLERLKEKFEQILREKLTILTKLEEKEETTLNIVCNTFTICGQFHASPRLASYIGDIFATIMKYLEILQPKSNLDMIASRISEVILYCLCNIAQGGKSSDRQGWRPILYKYYKECKYSDEIKFASAVSICLLLRNGESQREYKSEIEEIKIYLNEKKYNINKSGRTDYLGFTLEEIEGALAMAL